MFAKKLCTGLCVLALFFGLSAPGYAALEVPKNGTVRILMFTDLHQNAQTEPSKLLFMKKAIAKTKPDLIVLMGDTLNGWMSYPSTEALEEDIRYVLSPIVESGVPFSFVNGNHEESVFWPEFPQYQRPKLPDYPTSADFVDPKYLDMREKFGAWRQAQWKSIGDKIVRIGGDAYLPPDFLYTGAAYNQCIELVKDGTTRTQLFLFDPGVIGRDLEISTHELRQPQTDWFRRVAKPEIPKFIFLHVSPPEANLPFPSTGEYRYLRPDYRMLKGFTFTMPTTYAGNKRSVYAFPAFQEVGNVVALFHGHDHSNACTTTVDGIDIVALPASGWEHGYTAISALRGATLLTIDTKAKKPGTYRTKRITYRNVLGYFRSHVRDNEYLLDPLFAMIMAYQNVRSWAARLFRK